MVDNQLQPVPDDTWLLLILLQKPLLKVIGIIHIGSIGNADALLTILQAMTRFPVVIS